MKIKEFLRNKKVFKVGGILVIAMLVLTGCESKKDNTKTAENATQNQVQNVSENTTKQTENTTKNTTKNETSGSNTTAKNTTNNNTSNSSSESKKATTSKELTVNREGMSENVPSKEYSSSLGYTIRYATDNFKASHHDDKDWFETSVGTDCVVVEKENVSYSKKISSISNYKKTTVNGYEAVYTTRRAEGQYETTYYVNTGKDSTYMITTSCLDTTEYLEGLGHIMDAMVQTFALK